MIQQAEAVRVPGFQVPVLQALGFQVPVLSLLMKQKSFLKDFPVPACWVPLWLAAE